MTTLIDFLNAAESGDDEQAERLVVSLTSEDESALLAAVADNAVAGNSVDGNVVGNNDLRWWVVRALALVGGAASIAQISVALEDGDPLMRSCALLALAAIHARQPQSVQPQLARMVQRLQDDDGMVRQSASDALAQCGDDAVSLLGEVLRYGEHQGARTRAAQALRQIATMPAATVLYHCLNDANYMVHTYAYEGLEEMGLLETMLLAV